jgi:predicted small secreted protein
MISPFGRIVDTEECFMKKTMKKILMAALVAVIALSFAACSKGGDGKEVRITDSALIGTWYNDEALTDPYIEFKTGGKCIYTGGMEVEYKVKGTTIHVTVPVIGMKVFDLDDCKIEGKVLTCTTVNFPLTLYKK